MDTFPAALKPDRVKSVSLAYKTTVVEFENQYDQRFANDHLGKRGWKLSWGLMNQAEFDLLMFFFSGQLGQFRQFVVTDARINGGVPTPVFFASDKIEHETIKAGFYKCDVEIENR